MLPPRRETVSTAPRAQIWLGAQATVLLLNGVAGTGLPFGIAGLGGDCTVRPRSTRPAHLSPR